MMFTKEEAPANSGLDRKVYPPCIMMTLRSSQNIYHFGLVCFYSLHKYDLPMGRLDPTSPHLLPVLPGHQ